MNGRRLTLDTNILFYAMDREAGDRHELAMKIVDRAIFFDSILTLQSLSEFYAAVTRQDKMPPREAEAQLRDWMDLFPIVAAKSKTLLRAIKAVNQHTLSFWDALLWAAARDAGVTMILSEDFQHDRVLEGIQFCNPFQIKNPLPYIFNGAS
ncbi:MAG: PIN domain-containing protein [bacterium]|nr:PIN domain-containing protein [bacterium]